MDTAQESPAEEIARLRRCLNDLVGVMAVPALWAGGEARQVARTLMDALVGTLRPAFVFIRLHDAGDGPSTSEIVRGPEFIDGVAAVERIADELIESLGDEPQRWPARAQLSIESATFFVASARLGIGGEIGMVVVGSQRMGFPEQTERLLLDVAVNQASIGLQQERNLAAQRRVARELDKRVAERTAELAAAYELLKKSESESRLIVDSIPGLISVINASGELESANRQLFEYMGKSLEDLKQWETNDIIHADDRSGVVGTISQSIASGDPVDCEARLRRFDGVYRWFHIRGFPLHDAQGRIIRWYFLNTDVDKRKQVEEQLRRNEEFMLKAQRLSATGSFSWCVETDEIVFSEEASRIFGFEPGAAVTFPMIASRIHPDDLPLLTERSDAARSAGAGQDNEIRIRMPDGSLKYLHTTSDLARDVNGVREYIGAIQDVTQRRVAREALNQAQSELAHMSRITSLSGLTASIAHEINQPLSGIITNASTCLRMLQADPPNVDGARETARRTIRDGNRASDVIMRLRALFSKKDFTPEVMDLNETAREVIALIWNDLQRNGVTALPELAADLPTVHGDRVQLQQVILNLVRNGSEAMADVHDRPRRLLIRTGCESNGHVRLSVQDAGVGLGGQDLERLFDSFYTTKSGGMGIGLSVSRSIIQRHQGRIWAEPNDGPGATFAFTIPAGSEAAAAPATS